MLTEELMFNYLKNVYGFKIAMNTFHQYYYYKQFEISPIFYFKNCNSNFNNNIISYKDNLLEHKLLLDEIINESIDIVMNNVIDSAFCSSINKIVEENTNNENNELSVDYSYLYCFEKLINEEFETNENTQEIIDVIENMIIDEMYSENNKTSEKDKSERDNSEIEEKNKIEKKSESDNSEIQKSKIDKSEKDSNEIIDLYLEKVIKFDKSNFESPKSEINKKPNYKKFACKFCGKLYTKTDAVRKHWRKYHENIDVEKGNILSYAIPIEEKI